MSLGMQAMIARAELEIQRCKDFVNSIYSGIKTMAAESICIAHKETGRYYEQMRDLYKSNLPNYVKYEIHDERQPEKGILHMLMTLQFELSKAAINFGIKLISQFEKYSGVSGMMALQPAPAADAGLIDKGTGFHISQNSGRRKGRY